MDLEEDNMAGAGGVNPPNPPNICLPWLGRSALVVLSVQHQLPKHPDQRLLKFDLDKKYSAENHIDKLM